MRSARAPAIERERAPAASERGEPDRDGRKEGRRTVLLISNDPLAPRQRLAAPSAPPPDGAAWLADTGHRVVGRGRIAAAGNGWLALEGVEAVQPFRLWDAHETVLAYNPDGPTREAPERPEQRRFRERLMRAYGGRCAVTGCDVPDLLDAAHLRPWRLGGEGVLLRADLHRMIDRGLAALADGRFRLSRPAPAYVEAAYGEHDGARLRKPLPAPRR